MPLGGGEPDLCVIVSYTNTWLEIRRIKTTSVSLYFYSDVKSIGTITNLSPFLFKLRGICQMLRLLTVQSLSLYIDIINKKSIFHSTVTHICGLLFSEHDTGHCWTLSTAVMSLRQESLINKAFDQTASGI